MKYCEEYAALLDLFADGELPPEELERVRAHLENCPGCRDYVDDALAIRAGFPDAEDTVVPEGFAQGVMDRVRASASRDKKIIELKRRSARRWMGTAAALAACCALVVLVQTGPGNDAAAPAGEYGAAYDMAAAFDTAASAESEEAGIAPQAAPEMKEEPVEGAQIAPSARSKTAELNNKNLTLGATPPAEAAPEAAMDEAQFRASPTISEKQPALYLTQEEAGDLLDGFTAIWENAEERRYELNAEEYRALLEALGRREELPETEEGPFLVVVSGSLE